MRCENAPPLNASEPIVGLKPPAFPAEKLLSTLQALYDAKHYALAVSGGRDSMGLLAMAARAATLPDAPQFSVLTVDHGLRPEAADEARMVAEICAELDLPHHILTADEKLGATDIQNQARALRYRLMAAFCRPLKAPLVTAHHLYDQAETVAMRLARGSGVDGLAGMAAAQWLSTQTGALLVLRPFLDVPPQTLHTNDVVYIDDPSNRDLRFERVRWREKMPQMAAAGLSPHSLQALAHDMRKLKTQRDKALREWLDTHGKWHDYGVLMLPREALLSLPQGRLMRLLSACVRYFGGHAHPPRRDALRAVVTQMTDKPNGVAVLGGVMMRWRKTHSFIGREYAALAQNHAPVTDNGLWDARFYVAHPPHGHFVAPLGEKGLAALRQQGVVFDKTVPAAYHAVLPALFDENEPQRKTPCGLATEKHLRCVSSKHLFGALLEQGQDW